GALLERARGIVPGAIARLGPRRARDEGPAGSRRLVRDRGIAEEPRPLRAETELGMCELGHARDERREREGSAAGKAIGAVDEDALLAAHRLGELAVDAKLGRFDEAAEERVERFRIEEIGTEKRACCCEIEEAHDPLRLRRWRDRLQLGAVPAAAA